MHQHLALLAVEGKFAQHVLVVAVEVIGFSRRPLIVPRDFAGLRTNRDHRSHPQVVAGTRFPGPRAAVAGAPVGQIEFGIVRAGDPRRGTAALVRIVLRPGRIGLFRRIRRGVAAPDFLAGLRIQANHEATHTELAAGHAAHHDAVDYAGRAGDGVAFLPFGNLGFPHLFAGLGVQRIDMRIDRGHVHLAVEQRDTAVVQAAAHHARHGCIPLDIKVPLDAARAHVHRDHALDVGGVQGAVVNEGLALLAVLVGERRAPYRHQALDGIFVDLIELAETLLVIPHAIGQYIVGAAAVAVPGKLLLRLCLRASSQHGPQCHSHHDSFHNSSPI